jgi:DNA (cytosine-5)-methyltransferase 1
MRNEKPTHLDLFSGIGGFALAAGWAGFETVGFCDNEPYAQAVLKKHWPDVPIHGDIKALDGSAYRGITLLTGGFPCQPFSNAGKRRGKDDDRYLWPQMLRVIQEARPAWIVGENVVGIIGLALDQVCSDLEACGYEVEPIIIPACGVDAQHRRNRVWVVAGGGGDLADSFSMRESQSQGCKQEQREWVGNGCLVLADNYKVSIQPTQTSRDNEKDRKKSNDKFIDRCSSTHRGQGLQANWATEPSVGRVANGVSNRVDRIKGLGNSIVPQVAYQIIKGIAKLVKEKR